MTDDFIEERPKLYNKATIIIFSLLLSTFCGGMLYSQNLSETNNKKQIASVLIFSIIWNIIFFKIAHKFTSSFILTFIIPNIVGGIILSTFFWNEHFKNVSFITKSIWVPLLIVLVVYGLFAGVIFYK